MSASMAEGMVEVLSAHQGTYVAEDPDGYQWCIRCGGCEKALKGGKGNTAWDERDALLAAHQAEVLAANGYGKLEAPTRELKFLRGERKTLGKELDHFESQGHATVTIKYLRRFLGRRPE